MLNYEKISLKNLLFFCLFLLKKTNIFLEKMKKDEEFGEESFEKNVIRRHATYAAENNTTLLAIGID